MKRNSDLNRTARARMHAILSPEFFLMWVIATWFERHPGFATHDLRRVLQWAVRRYLDGKLDV